jgi:hypothetical protein
VAATEKIRQAWPKLMSTFWAAWLEVVHRHEFQKRINGIMMVFPTWQRYMLVIVKAGLCTCFEQQPALR